MKRINEQDKKAQKTFSVLVNVMMEVDAENNEAVEKLLQEMDYNFKATSEEGFITEAYISDWDIYEVE